MKYADGPLDTNYRVKSKYYFAVIIGSSSKALAGYLRYEFADLIVVFD